MFGRQSLLEKARTKKAGSKQPLIITPEHIDLAIAWARNEVTYSQVADAMGKSKAGGPLVYCFLARALSQALTEGYVLTK